MNYLMDVEWQYFLTWYLQTCYLVIYPMHLKHNQVQEDFCINNINN